jgi:hypothetical protein
VVWVNSWRREEKVKGYINGFWQGTVRFRLCMSMEWMNECVDWLLITQLLKACLSTVCGS